MATLATLSTSVATLSTSSVLYFSMKGLFYVYIPKQVLITSLLPLIDYERFQLYV
jgi:hypothetical protein